VISRVSTTGQKKMNALQYQTNTRRAPFMNFCSNAGTVIQSCVPPFRRLCGLYDGIDTVLEAYRIHHLPSPFQKCPSRMNCKNHNPQFLSVLVVSITRRSFCLYKLDKNARSHNVLSFNTQFSRGTDPSHDKAYFQSVRSGFPPRV